MNGLPLGQDDLLQRRSYREFHTVYLSALKSLLINKVINIQVTVEKKKKKNCQVE